jgi:hypothetical protein
MPLKRCKRSKLSGILALLVVISISFAVLAALAALAALLPAVSADTDGIVTTGAAVNPGVIDINKYAKTSGIDLNSYLTTRVTLTANSVNVTEKVPVDVMHVIDRSESMDWYGDVIHNSNGTLTSGNYTKIDGFSIDSSISSFDVLLVRQNPDERYEYLQIRSPSGEQYDYYNQSSGITYVHSPSAERIVVSGSGVETGVWAAWACVCPSDKAPRDYKFAVQVQPERLDAAKDAAKTFVGLMSDQDQIGVVSFAFSEVYPYTIPTLDVSLTLLDEQAKRDSVNSTIDSLSAFGATPIGDGIQKAKVELTSTRSRDEAMKIMVLLSDGVNTVGSDPRAEAEEAAAENIKIFTVGFGEADRELLKDIADITGGKYYYTPSGSDLQEIYETISEDIIAISSRNHAYYVLTDNIKYAGNPTKKPYKIIGNTLMWGVRDLAPDKPWDVSFDVRPTRMGKDLPANEVPFSVVTYELGTTEETKKVSAGGCWILSPADSTKKATFGFVIQHKMNKESPEGELEYQDHATGMNLHSESINELSANSGNATVIKGDATVNGVSGYTFIVIAEDSGSGNMFMISITGPDNFSYQAGDILQGGYIMVHSGSSGFVEMPQDFVDVLGISLKVVNVSVPPRERFIGESVPVTGYAVLENTGSEANVSVKLCVDGYPLSRKKSSVPTVVEEDIPVSTTWIPMSSGKHSISIHVHGLKDDGTEFWTEAQGFPNTNKTDKKIYIKKVG